MVVVKLIRVCAYKRIRNGKIERVRSQAGRPLYLDRFRRMLLDGQPVSAVSDALGFEYPQHFTRMFKKAFGFAPSKVSEKRQ